MTIDAKINKQLADAWRELFTAGEYEFDPMIASEIDGDLSCFFCGGDLSQHEDGCIYMRVKAILDAEDDKANR